VYVNKKLYIIIGLISLVFISALAVYLIRESQDPRGRADENTTVLSFSPTTGTFAPSAEIPVNITLDTKGKNITGADISIVLGSTVNFISFTPSNTFNSQLINSFNSTTRTLRFSAVNTSSSQVTGVITLGTLKVAKTTPGTASLSFSRAQIIADGQDTAVPVDFTATASYTVGETVRIYFNPATNPATRNTNVTTALMLDGKTNNITGLDVTLAIPQGLDFVAFNPTNTFNSVLINSYNPTSRTFRIASVDTTANTITGSIKIGDLVVKGNTNGTSSITVTNQQITASQQTTPLSVTSDPATFQITDGQLTPTVSPTASPTITQVISPTITLTPTQVPPTATLTPIVTVDPQAIEFTFTVFLHNIGNFGDTVNPGGFQFSNKEPKHPTKTVKVELISANAPTIAKEGTITYDPAAGNFKGKVYFDRNTPAKTYQIKIKSPQYLRRDLGLHQLAQGTKINFPVMDFVTGDINNDNKLDTLDYNILLTCYTTSQNSACTDTQRVMADINDDGKIDTTDYNLFIRELSVRTGD
jgi:hypothetical protein